MDSHQVVQFSVWVLCSDSQVPLSRKKGAGRFDPLRDLLASGQFVRRVFAFIQAEPAAQSPDAVFIILHGLALVLLILEQSLDGAGVPVAHGLLLPEIGASGGCCPHLVRIKSALPH